MNCFEALKEQLRNCEPCRLDSYLIDFKDMPAEKQVEFRHYDKNIHLVLYCGECDYFKLLGE